MSSSSASPRVKTISRVFVELLGIRIPRVNTNGDGEMAGEWEGALHCTEEERSMSDGRKSIGSSSILHRGNSLKSNGFTMIMNFSLLVPSHALPFSCVRTLSLLVSNSSSISEGRKKIKETRVLLFDTENGEMCLRLVRNSNLMELLLRPCDVCVCHVCCHP